MALLQYNLYQPHDVRSVVEECGDLTFRLSMLDSFIESPEFTELSQRERQDLNDQKEAMGVYLMVLIRRVQWLTT